MGFYEVLDQVVALLRQRGRVTYGALKREFQLDEAFLEDLKDELIKAQRLAVDEQGDVLVWTGSLERWAHVKAGHGHIVLLRGEAGIGKSRLVQMLQEQVAGEPHTRWECRCSPYYQHTAFYPLIDLFQRALVCGRSHEDAAGVWLPV